MNNFVIGLKRFFTNKNVVTILLVLVILAALYIGYSTSIKSQTEPIQMPVAAKKISQNTQITAESIKYKSIPKSMISDNAIRYSSQLIGKYVTTNVTVPEGSLFYKEWVVSEEDVPGNWIEKIDQDNNEVGYYMDVNVASTLGNSVLPNTYIDIYMQAIDENGKIIFGKLIRNIKVLVVHDSQGRNVFDDTDEIKTPSKIGFAVNKDYYILLNKAKYLNVELVIAPKGYKVPSDDRVIVTSKVLRDYIDTQATTIEEDIIAEEVKNEGNTSEATTTETTQDVTRQ